MIVNVVTEQAHRRRGIARKLMEILIQWCRAGGFGSILLHASDEGRALYESLGFKPTNEMRLMLR
jgi:GNAT superfamily N-acetyltransferase